MFTSRGQAVDTRGNVSRSTNVALLTACLLGLGSVLAGAQEPAAKDAPTASKSAESLDQIWQSASSKYDGRRDAVLADVDKAIANGPFKPGWDSLEQYKVPEWYKDAKFGIFIHWGVYAVPAFGSEWYPREMYQQGSEINRHQVATYGPLDKFGYKDFIPMFKAEHFDAQAWAKLFKDAGAKYVVPVFEHHDGFAMYDSGLSDWTAMKMGPHRDTSGELAVAVRAQGMHLGASSHRIEHDWFMDGGRQEPSDVNDPANAALYGPAHDRISETNDLLSEDWTYVSPAYAKDWLARDAEIVEKYHPDLMYFDWWIGQPSVRPYLEKFAAFYYNASSARGTVGIINYKLVDMRRGSAVLDIERGQLSSIYPDTWQTDTSVSNKSWGYIDNDTFKTPDFIVHQLADIVSKNGNLLLNIGPKSDGTIPQPVQQVLLDVGSWLKVNGDAIYGTRPWTVFGEGPTKVEEGSFHDVDTKPYTADDFRFTTKGGALYAIEMAWPEKGEALVHSLPTSRVGTSPVDKVTLLATGQDVPFQQKEDGLHLQVKGQAPGKYAFAYRITFKQ